jgi:raffinose/stachyose/melibiose transport system permease protein
VSASLARPRLARYAGASARVIAYAAVMVITVYPLLFVILTALKTPQEFTRNFWGLPSAAGFTFDNLREVWFNYKFYIFFKNSLIVSAGATACTLALSVLAGYAFARLSFPLSETIFVGILAVMFLPVFSYVIPLFIQMRSLHLTNTLFNLVLVYTFFNLPRSVFIARSFFSSIPSEIAESGLVDGAGQLAIFGRLMLPLATPAVSAIVILSFVGNWGEYIWVTVSNTKETFKTIPTALSYFTSMTNVFWWYQMAALFFTIFPLLAIYIVFSRFFIRGMTEGALKG